MDGLTAFGLFAVTAMLVTYALEARGPALILAFAGASVLGSAYGFLQGAWPFGAVEAVWVLVAVRRYRLAEKGQEAMTAESQPIACTLSGADFRTVSPGSPR